MARTVLTSWELIALLAHATKNPAAMARIRIAATQIVVRLYPALIRLPGHRIAAAAATLTAKGIKRKKRAQCSGLCSGPLSP